MLNLDSDFMRNKVQHLCFLDPLQLSFLPQLPGSLKVIFSFNSVAQVARHVDIHTNARIITTLTHTPPIIVPSSVQDVSRRSPIASVLAVSSYHTSARCSFLTWAGT